MSGFGQEDAKWEGSRLPSFASNPQIQDLERFAQARWPHYLDRDQDDQNTHAINGHLAFMDSRYLTIPRQNFSNLLYFFLSTMALKRS